MAKWLLKTEPDCYSWDNLVRDKKATWDARFSRCDRVAVEPRGALMQPASAKIAKSAKIVRIGLVIV